MTTSREHPYQATALMSPSEAAQRSLTVIVPVLNEEMLLPSFLAKVVSDLEDARLDWELILVNDRSTDTSNDIMRTFVSRTPRARLIELNGNHGPGANLHEAYRVATKRYVCYATVDGFYDTRLLPELMTHFADHDAVSAYRTDLKAHTPRRRLQTLVNVWLIRLLFPYRFTAYHTLQIHRADFFDKRISNPGRGNALSRIQGPHQRDPRRDVRHAEQT